MCSAPVMLGGGSAMTNAGLSLEISAAPTRSSSQRCRHFGSTVLGSKALSTRLVRVQEPRNPAPPEAMGRATARRSPRTPSRRAGVGSADRPLSTRLCGLVFRLLFRCSDAPLRLLGKQQRLVAFEDRLLGDDAALDVGAAR